MPIIKNTARQISVSVRLSGSTDGPYVAATWPDSAVAKMYYSKDGATPVAIIPTRIDATTGGWLLSVSTMTAAVWNCDELRVFWEGTGILSGSEKFYPEADYTATVAGRIDAPISGVMVIHTGTAQAGAASTITLANAASATNSIYVGELVWIVSGTGAGQIRTITGYVGATRVATVSRDWAVNPDATSVYRVLPIEIPALDSTLRVTVGSNGDKTGYSLTTAPLDAAGTRSAVGLASANLDTQLSTISGYLDTEVAAILATVDTEVAAIKAKTDNLPASPAAVGSAMTLATDAVNATSLAASAVTEIAAGISIATAVYAVQGIRTRISDSEDEFITLVKGDDKSLVLLFEDESHNPALIPSTATAALLDSAGSSVGTATVTTITAAAGYMLLRLQAPSSGNLPTTLRITFAGGSGAAYKHDIPVRSWA